MTKKEEKLRKQIARLVQGKGDNTFSNIIMMWDYADLVNLKFDNKEEQQLMDENMLGLYKREERAVFHNIEMHKDGRHAFRNIKRRLKKSTVEILRKAQEKFGYVYQLEEALKDLEAKQEGSPFKNLLAKLQIAIADFKTLFMERTKNWMTNDFYRLEKYFEINLRESDEFTEWKTNKYPDYMGNYKYRAWKSEYYAELAMNVSEAKKLGFDKWLAKKMKQADETFEAKTAKLASRLVRYEFDHNTLEVVGSVYNDVNFELMVKDKNQVKEFYTIIASGEIQRPHYRYLAR